MVNNTDHKMNIAVGDELWRKAKSKAALQGITMTQLINNLLQNYVGGK